MSWGKDSTVLGHLALETLEHPLQMAHLKCAHEIPGGECVAAYFAERAQIHELQPINTLEESLVWLRDVGLPHERAKSVQQRIIKTRKKDRATEWLRGIGFEVTALGMRAQESLARKACMKYHGLTYQLKDSGHWVTNPIGHWSHADVWAYLVSRELPWHPLYDHEWAGQTRETIRNGGWLYTDGADRGWAAWLRRFYPELFERLAEEFPRVRHLT
jgi:3'-phosphoadenosine 5'-phosphosulfate sulfotransferase (PAPS reductase)/FAD synthetase